MTPEEAKKHIAAEDEKLRLLEAEVGRLAGEQPTPVLLAMLRALVEMVCGAQGPHFATHYKIKFYAAVLLMLRKKGIS